MNKYKQWDTVVVPFPFTEGNVEKRRPALIVSKNNLAAKYHLYWLIMITSATHAGWDCDVEVKNLEVAGLPKPSVIRVAKVATLQEDKIIRRLGHVDPDIQKKIRKMIKWFV